MNYADAMQAILKLVCIATAVFQRLNNLELRNSLGSSFSDAVLYADRLNWNIIVNSKYPSI